MGIKLSSSDYRYLTKIVQKLPDFEDRKDRRMLISQALTGHPRADLALSRLDLDGSSMLVAGEVVRFLAGFGQIAYGKEALGVFIDFIRPLTDDDDANFINSLFQKYSLESDSRRSRPID